MIYLKYLIGWFIILIVISYLIALFLCNRKQLGFIYLYTALILSVIIMYLGFGTIPISNIMKQTDGQGGFANLFIQIWIYVSLYSSYMIYILLKILNEYFIKVKISVISEIIFTIILQIIVAIISYYILSVGNTF